MYEIFEKLCKMRGITPYRFCEDAGVGTSTISTWKKNNSQCRPKLAKIVCEYFGISHDYLMTGKEPSDSKYDSEMALLVGKLRKDKEMSEALIKYFDSSIEIKKHIVSTINMLCDSSK